MSNKFPKRVKYEIIIVLLIFAVSFLFPFCTFYYLGESDVDVIEKPQYLNSFVFGYAYIVFMLTAVSALISGRKIVQNILNILVLIFLLLSYLIISLGFAWWGASPFHPTFSAGFVLVNVTIIYFVFRSFFWIDSVILYTKRTRFKLIVAIVIPLIFILGVLYINNKAATQPIMRSQWIKTKNDRTLNEEYWDYMEAYDGFATKYFSKPASDSLKDTYVLDSVRFSFADSSPNAGEKFTLPAKNGELDIEEVFEDYLE